MLDLSPHLRRSPVGFLIRICQRPIPAGSFIGEVFHVRRNLFDYILLSKY